MYSVVGIQKLSASQRSKLKNGHSIRIKEGTAHKIHLTDAQLKGLKKATKKGSAYTINFSAAQTEKHGAGFFSDLAKSAKSFAISTVKKNRDLINPIIGRARSYAKSGIQKLADKANEKVDYLTPEIQGEGIIGDALKGLIGMTGLGMKKRGRPRKVLTEVVKTVRVRKGKGILSSIIKAVAPAAIDALSGAAKNQVSGMGVAKKKNFRNRYKKSSC